MTTNIAASVRARLANKARESRRPFQELFQYYGLERFLYRFSSTEQCKHFLLKGALMLRVWKAPKSRPTRDIDLLGYLHNDLERIEGIARQVCELAVSDDGLRFDAATVVGERIKADAEYEGVRFRFSGFLERARIPLQLDIGFGDVVHPSAQEMSYPTILNFPAPRLHMHPRESVVAEKFEAMVHLGSVNSRMKDFFDIWLLAWQFDFAGAELARRCGVRSPVALPTELVARNCRKGAHFLVPRLDAVIFDGSVCPSRLGLPQLGAFNLPIALRGSEPHHLRDPLTFG